jgi:heme exporter protein C
MKPVFIIYALFTLVLLSYGLNEALVAAPTEQTMGEIQRIFYYHVPSAWVAFLCFFANFLTSVAYLASLRSSGPRAARKVLLGICGILTVALLALPPHMDLGTGIVIVILWILFSAFALVSTRSPHQLDAIAVATAEVGVVFNTVVLVTGPLWAKPVWGIWWTWDARLTSTFIMWLIYISYLLLRKFSTANEQTPKLAAALAIFGFVDVPIVYMSIRWWRTQHPSPVIGGGENSGLDPHMLHALLWNFAAFAAYGSLVVWRRYQLERGRQQLNTLYRTQGAA